MDHPANTSAVHQADAQGLAHAWARRLMAYGSGPRCPAVDRLQMWWKGAAVLWARCSAEMGAEGCQPDAHQMDASGWVEIFSLPANSADCAAAAAAEKRHQAAIANVVMRGLAAGGAPEGAKWVWGHPLPMGCGGSRVGTQNQAMSTHLQNQHWGDAWSWVAHPRADDYACGHPFHVGAVPGLNGSPTAAAGQSLRATSEGVGGSLTVPTAMAEGGDCGYLWVATAGVLQWVGGHVGSAWGAVVDVQTLHQRPGCCCLRALPHRVPIGLVPPGLPSRQQGEYWGRGCLHVGTRTVAAAVGATHQLQARPHLLQRLTGLHCPHPGTLGGVGPQPAYELAHRPWFQPPADVAVACQWNQFPPA